MMTTEPLGSSAWESEGAELKVLRRHLSQGTVTVAANVHGGWSWWVDTPTVRSSGSGIELTQSRAKFRAMLVYLAMTREVAAT